MTTMTQVFVIDPTQHKSQIPHKVKIHLANFSGLETYVDELGKTSR
jgi:hypothetical protein